MKKRFLILSILLLCSSLVFAQGRFTATASKINVGVGEQFEVDFSVNGNGNSFTPPDFQGFQVMEGPNVSSSMTSVNGNTSVNVMYSYIVAATKEGSFTITAAAIVVNGHTLTSNSLKIKVKGQAPPQQAQQTQAMQQAQQQAAAAAADIPSDDGKDLSKSIFVKAEADKTHAYVGEQVTIAYKVYTRVGIMGGQPDKAPDLNGFFSLDVPNKGQNVWKSETYNGRRYNTTILKQTVLFPQHAGDLSIDPLSLTLLIRLQLPSRNTLDDFFGNFKDVKYQAKSTPLTIHVVPLPTAGKPVNFSGAVGDFTVDADVDKKELKANETLNYTFNISGKGNLNLINAPAILPPVDFEKYDPKSTDHIVVDEKGVSGSRQYSYLLIPRHQGDYTLSPVDFSYFNPATKRYVTLSTKAFHIKVNKGDAQANVPAFNSADQQDIKTLDRDIRYIKISSPGLTKNGEGFYNSVLFYVLFLLGPLSFAGALYYRNWLTEYNSDAVKVRSRQANKIAAKHLTSAQKELTTGNKNAFFDAIAKGLYGYLSDKLNIPVADLNKDNIEERLKARSVDNALIKQLDDTMNLCEMARFAPVTGIAQQEVFEKAKNIINEIENKI